MPQKIFFLNETDIKNIVDSQLKKKDKIISRPQLREMLRNELSKELKEIYKKIDRQRRRVNELELSLKRMKVGLKWENY